MDKRVPNSEIRRVWLDDSMPSEEAAASIGLKRATLWRRAKCLGLPSRKSGRREAIPAADLRMLWNAGVLARDIADHYGCQEDSIGQAARRLGLPKRKPGPKSRQTLSQYKDELLGRALQRLARDEATTRDTRLKAELWSITPHEV